VVRKDVEPGDLAMNVSPQRNLADWVLTKRSGTAAADAAHKAKN
jgi:bifunctional UDP-N-acetylglucosamine pyrophosphorylase/glucosamine-1-phosphate N-acetyltransferase